MDPTIYFSTMAQLAGVIIGFANLANAIAKPGVEGKDFNLNKIRILAITEGGLFTIFFCVVPILFGLIEVDKLMLFKLLSAVYGLGGSIYVITSAARVKKLMGTSFPVPFASKAIQFSAMLNWVVIGANAFELFGSNKIIFIYCAAILFSFISMCVLFIRLIYWILSN